MDDGFTGSEYLIRYKGFKTTSGPLMEDLGVSIVALPRPKPRQTAATAVRTWFNFEPLKDFRNKREARAFIERFFHENMPVEASVPFKREMLGGLSSILSLV